MKVHTCLLVVVFLVLQHTLAWKVLSDPNLPYIDLYVKATEGYECFRVPSLLSTTNNSTKQV